MGDIEIEAFRVGLGNTVDLSEWPTVTPLADSKTLKAELTKTVERFADLQEVLYADAKKSVLLIFQGMDAAGKDSTIKHVTSGVNPQGFKVTSFQQPTYADIDHTYLRRYWLALPERGKVGVFNRSHYEEVVVMRVRPGLLTERKLPTSEITEEFWRQRFDDINAFERHLVENGTQVIKFFLHLSKDEQRDRLIDRLKRPDKHWKFDPRDLEAREQWDDFQGAYQAAISATSQPHAPWYIVPADNKPAMRLIVAEIIVDTLSRLDIAYPEPTAEQARNIEKLLKKLR